ncbi:hypothetical protein RJ639_009266 [Escallonia herrerae]|uniref:Nucleotidyl transferase domain-containing protein n=1 Tax=Escallonia herrerae TaxID=1293975 RepID=A0AA88VTI7_9ASTE|nr:hypothetical protein RJ639_009266 [Escallonia herrerae]
MEASVEKVVAVIMVGGPTKGTRFRPLSFNTPEPLFPLAGQPMIPNLAQVLLIGFYEERDFALYVSSISNELKVPIRYLREDKPHGSAGGFYYFRDIIMEDDPTHIFLLNFDICCSFPLHDMLEAHRRFGKMGTLLVIRVSAESANQFGELVADPVTKEVLHYTEKPETFVSDLINCGVYVFTPEIFSAIQDVFSYREDTGWISKDFVRLDQDILSPLAGKKQLYTYETMEFWEQIKTPGMSLKCSALYLAQSNFASPHLLATGNGTKSATIVGYVYVHPSAKVHSTAKIGPNVSISANVRVAAGVRLLSCIILDDVEIKENAVVMHAIVGWKSSLGRWSRVQASFLPVKSVICKHARCDLSLVLPTSDFDTTEAEGDYSSKLGITILGWPLSVFHLHAQYNFYAHVLRIWLVSDAGEAVTVEDEVVVTNSIILPNKTLNLSVQDEIIL